MVKIDTSIINQLWHKKELSAGERHISARECSRQTGLSMLTITNIMNGSTTRLDLPILTKLCEWLNIEAGPIPFLVIEEDKPKP